MQTLTYVDFKYCLMLPGVSVTNKCQIPYPELSVVLPCPGPRTPAEYCAQCDCRHWVTLTLALPGYISHTVSKYSIAFGEHPQYVMGKMYISIILWRNSHLKILLVIFLWQGSSCKALGLIFVRQGKYCVRGPPSPRPLNISMKLI